uniref:FHA domain-containing protein n=1 Tax=Aegilops tauschii subsp. strangulata TaxID=200361 RepID=A0A453AQN2_AEGTS
GRSAKRAKAQGKTTRVVSGPVFEAAAKAAGRAIESSQLSAPAAERSAGAVAASSTVSNSGARKKRTPRRLPPSDETTAEEMTQWKTRRGAASSRTHAWARLISQSSQYPTVPIYASYFTVGHGGKHDLKLTDALSGSLVCRLRHVRRGAALEVSISKVVYVNGKALDKSAKVTLTGGDEVVFSSLGKHAYVSFFVTDRFLSTCVLLLSAITGMSGCFCHCFVKQD